MVSLHAVSIFLVTRGHNTQPLNFISVVNILKISIVDARATIAVIGDNKNGMNFLWSIHTACGETALAYEIVKYIGSCT